jgi:hypothetical protein
MKKKKVNTVSDWLNLLDGTFSDGDIIELPVLSGSMMPLLIPGKKIRIKCLKKPDVRAGDIIVYKKGRELISHRLIIKIPFVKNIYLYQKGDTNRYGSWIKIEQAVGVVDSVQDEWGNFISIDTPEKKREGKGLAIKHMFYSFWNIALIFPRRMKRWVEEQ